MFNDDYGSISGKGWSFYYGYEVLICETCNVNVDINAECKELDHDVKWCFEGNIGGATTIIPSSKLNKGELDIAVFEEDLQLLNK